MSDDSSCCNGRCCPYGGYFALPVILVTTATILSWIVTYSCTFLLYSDGTIENWGLGPWLVEDWDVLSAEDGVECVAWKKHAFLEDEDVEEIIDAPIKFGRAITMMLSLLSLILMGAVLVMSCKTFPRSLMRTLAILCWVFAFMSASTMIMFATDNCRDEDDNNSSSSYYYYYYYYDDDKVKCTLGGGGICAALAMLFWICAGVSISFLRPKEEEDTAAVAPHHSHKLSSSSPKTHATSTSGTHHQHSHHHQRHHTGTSAAKTAHKKTKKSTVPTNIDV